MTDTPRTDEKVKIVRLTVGCVELPENHMVSADFARQLEKELAEAQTEIEQMALEIENQKYTITCASEENQQVKESLAEAQTEIERQTDRIMSDACIISAAALAIAERDKLIEQMREALRLALAECRSTHCENEIIAALAATKR